MDCQIYLEAEKQEQDICLQPEAYNQASGGTIEITENGTYDVTKYQTAEVDVPVDASAAFSTVIDLEAAGTTADMWYKKAFVKWEVLPMMPFQIADSVTSLAGLFQNTNATKVKLTGGENVTDMAQICYGCEALQEVDLSELNGSSLTTLYYAFRDCINLRKVNIGILEAPSLTNVGYAFYGCDSIESADFSKWKAENLTNIAGLFFLAQLRLIDIDLSGWRTTKVADMSSAFRTTSGEGARYINISGWTTESLTNNSRIFQAPGIEAIVIDSPALFRLTSNNSFYSGSTPSIYVPDNLVDEYKSATNWTTVANQIKPLSELPQEVKDVFHMA